MEMKWSWCILGTSSWWCPPPPGKVGKLGWTRDGEIIFFEIAESCWRKKHFALKPTSSVPTCFLFWLEARVSVVPSDRPGHLISLLPSLQLPETTNCSFSEWNPRGPPFSPQWWFGPSPNSPTPAAAVRWPFPKYRELRGSTANSYSSMTLAQGLDPKQHILLEQNRYWKQ